MKLDKKQSELVKELEKRRKAKLPTDQTQLEIFKVFLFRVRKISKNCFRSGMTTARHMKLISFSGRKMLTSIVASYHHLNTEQHNLFNKFYY